jgi:hypothetical protein
MAVLISRRRLRRVLLGTLAAVVLYFLVGHVEIESAAVLERAPADRPVHEARAPRETLAPTDNAVPTAVPGTAVPPPSKATAAAQAEEPASGRIRREKKRTETAFISGVCTNHLRFPETTLPGDAAANASSGAAGGANGTAGGAAAGGGGSSGAAAADGNRVLVVYAVTPAREYDAMLEWDNFGFFLRNGVIAPGQRTALFAGVDYVFVKFKKDIAAPVVCAERENVRTVLVPNDGCHLCAHAAVLNLLNLTVGGNSTRAYAHVVFLTSGVRGPFAAPSSVGWIDAVAMAGTAGYARETVTTLLFSFGDRFGAQSYFASMPVAAVRAAHASYEETCGRSKQRCVSASESGFAELLFRNNFSMHSLGQNVTVASSANVTAYLSEHPTVRDVNPATVWTDPCDAVFVRFGGREWRDHLVPKSVMRAVRLLSMWQKPQHGVRPMSSDTFDEMASRRCRWSSE